MKGNTALVMLSIAIVAVLAALVCFSFTAAAHVEPRDQAVDACTTLCGDRGVASFARGGWNDTTCLCNPPAVK